MSHPSPEPYVNKPIKQENNAKECYARSTRKSTGSPMVQPNVFGVDEVDTSQASPPMVQPNVFGVDGVNTSQASPNVGASSSSVRTKKSRSRRSGNFAGEEVGLGIAKGLADVAKALNEQEWVNELHAAVMEMKEEFPRELLKRALFYLVKHKSKGQVFMARSHASRAKWLQSFSTSIP